MVRRAHPTRLGPTAPIGAWACKRIPHRPFLFLVGLLVIGLSVRTLLQIWR